MGRLWSLLFLTVPILGVAIFVLAVIPGGVFDDHWLPVNINEHGQIIDDLFMFILYLTGVIFIGTGSELDLCVQAAKKLTTQGHKIRVVSMPCVELFEEQSDSYKEEVLPTSVRKRIVVEAAESFGWHKYIGLDGDSVTMNSFGASAPGGTCMEKFGFTVENVVTKAKKLLS